MLHRYVPSLAIMMMIALVNTAVAQGPAPAPVPPGPEPTGCVNMVRVNGVIRENLRHEFIEGGYWEMWDEETGDLVGWGTWEQDETTGNISYVNESGDGGGGQTGTYAWDAEKAEWNRIAASHPNAPPLQLIPPL